MFDNNGQKITRDSKDEGWRELGAVLNDPGGIPVDLPLARNRLNPSVCQDNLALTIERHQTQMKAVVEYAAKLESTVNSITQHMGQFAGQQVTHPPLPLPRNY